jgi:hypothetical protein
MSETVKVILLVGLVLGVIAAWPTESEPVVQPVAVTNTRDNAGKSAFIDGCMSEGGTRSECLCMVNNLLVLHPDFLTNTTRMNRILAEGYNLTETSEMSKCFEYEEL